MGRKSVSYFGFLGLESESFSLFPHLFEWASQKPHLSYTALQALNKESTLLGFWVSWVKTNIQAFVDVLDADILSVPVWGEDGEIREIHLLWQ